MAKKTNYIAKVPDEQGLINYSAEEHAVWRDLYAQQIPSTKKYAADVYLKGLDLLDMPANRIPQCLELTERLMPLSGWRVAPVPALIGFGRFFNMLAEKTFPAASFIRSRADYDYIEEPDIFHEIFGHTPLLTNPGFAHFSDIIGKIGQRVEPADCSWLIRLYWFTIQFGLTVKNGHYDALGAGLTSSPTELIYSMNSPVPERREFNVIDILRTPYRIDIHQPVYFVLENIDDLFQAADRDLLSDIRQAQSLGLFEPRYKCQPTGQTIMTTQLCDLSDQTCEPCQGGMAALDPAEAKTLLEELHPDWQLSSDSKVISRRFKFKGFARALQMANMIAWLGDRQGHHPDIAFGWGYCSVSFTTHEINGLSNNDFICAAKLDQITA